MSMYKNKKTTLFLLFVIMHCAIHGLDGPSQESDQLDVMVDFAYPISAIQSVRQDLNQALYSSQQNNLESVVNLLQQALSKFMTRQSIEQEDREYIQAIINQIDALISSLEKQDKSTIILDLCQQFQDRL